MSKREKRLARQQSKLEKQLEKQARQVITPATPKAVKKTISPDELKTIKALAIESNGDKKLAWARNHEDRDGVWSWGVDRDWGEELDRSEIVPFMEGYYEKTWSRIRDERTGGRHRRARNFSYHLSQIKKEAYDRLAELELEDREDIFRFRMTGERRLYGVIFGHVFCTVWYDPTHDIYNGKKK